MGGITEKFVNFCRSKGVTVVEMPGWQNRGEGGFFDIRGILLHHDAMGLHNDNVPQYMSQNGVPGAQLWIKYTGELYILAAGLKWHAGSGRGFGNIPANGGNAYCVGIETDYTGSGPRPPAIDATIHLVTKCLVDFYGMNPQRDCALHMEYAPDRKVDLSNFDANEWRNLAGKPFAPPVVIPPVVKDWFDMANAQDLTNALRGLIPQIAEAVWEYQLASLNDGQKYSAEAFVSSIDRDAKPAPSKEDVAEAVWLHPVPSLKNLEKYAAQNFLQVIDKNVTPPEAPKA